MPSDFHKLAGTANAQLEEHYNSILAKWNVLREKEEHLGRVPSIPCFVKANPAYFAAKRKVVFVGQETHGWWTDHTGDKKLLTGREIGNFYEGIWDFLQNYRSPYWMAVREIAETLGISSPSHSFIFTNVFPCDLDKKQAPLSLHDEFRHWKVLPTELNILRPNYVIFFCGRGYYGNLESYFGKMPDQYISSATPLVHYTPPEASWKGVVTYHPNYLWRSGRWDLLQQIVEYIEKDQPDS